VVFIQFGESAVGELGDLLAEAREHVQEASAFE